jgi:hypothetical protein
MERQRTVAGSEEMQVANWLPKMNAKRECSNFEIQGSGGDHKRLRR